MVKYFLKTKIENNFRIIHDLDGFDEDGFNKKGFDRNGFKRRGINECGYNKNNELACEEKLKQAIREYPNTYQYATLRLKQFFDLAIFFLDQGGSFSLTSKHLSNNKEL